MAPSDENKPPAVVPETAPDPDEDDLDDLDDMLDEFASTKLQESKAPKPSTTAAPEASGPGRPGAAADALEGMPEMDADFAQQLQAGMAQMMKDLETNPDMARQFEELMASFGDQGPPAPSAAAKSTKATPPPSSSASEPKATAAAATTAPAAAATQTSPQPAASSDATSAKAQEDAFQDTIRRTMERMRDSSTSASAASTAAGPGDDAMMAQLLQSLGAGGADGDGEDAFSKVLLGMMEQLTNKDVLYEPMKELDTKFPDWLRDNAASLPAEDKERYELQRGLVREIVAKFDQPGYSDSKPEDREYIVDRMQKMQAAGAPPPDLVGDVNAAEEMFKDVGDTGCPQQ